MRKSNLQIVVDTALQWDDSIIMDHVDNGYVDSHTDTYYSDWGGSDYDDDSSSSKKQGSGEQEGCFTRGLEIIIAIVVIMYILSQL